MDSTLLWIILFTFAAGVLSVIASSIFLVLPLNVRAKTLGPLISLAIGTLLGAAFLGLLPQAFNSPYTKAPQDIAGAILVGLLVFFILEKLVLWRHCHHESCEAHIPGDNAKEYAAGRLILIGDSFHNFIDGILIAGAFITDIRLGILTGLAVTAHEIPQEVGDLAILLKSGYSGARALAYNIATSITSVIGGVIGFYFFKESQHILPYVLAFAAASFIYVAMADLIPGLHKRVDLKTSAQQFALILSGVSIIYFMSRVLD
jgi:zinc and cadmium transporter